VQLLEWPVPENDVFPNSAKPFKILIESSNFLFKSHKYTMACGWGYLKSIEIISELLAIFGKKHLQNSESENLKIIF
jgi:hypothetical protein